MSETTVVNPTTAKDAAIAVPATRFDEVKISTCVE
jgi:hypothetical protein